MLMRPIRVSQNWTIPKLSLRPVTALEAFYKAFQVGLEKFGDFLRELAVLLLVFIPIDYWKADLSWMRLFIAVGASAFVFGCGLASEYAAIAVKRYRDLYEEEQGKWFNLTSSR
jgi:hypothetical protein